MNILSRIPFFNTAPDATQIDPELEAKRERIKYHRDHVRNGPRKTVSPTNGQLRRAVARGVASEAKKSRRKQVRDHFAQQREAATLRGHLQIVGIVPFGRPETTVTAGAVEDSLHWLCRRYVEKTKRPIVTDADLGHALLHGMNRYQRLEGLPATELSPRYAVGWNVTA